MHGKKVQIKSCRAATKKYLRRRRVNNSAKKRLKLDWIAFRRYVVSHGDMRENFALVQIPPPPLSLCAACICAICQIGAVRSLTDFALKLVS